MSFQYNLIYGGNNEIINSFKIKKENDSKIENNEQNNNNNNPIRIKKKNFFVELKILNLINIQFYHFKF